MKTFFKTLLASLIGTILASIVLFFLFFLVIIGIMSSASDAEVSEIEKHSILTFDFSSSITDREPDNPFSNFDFMNLQPDKSTGLNIILENINKAKTDDNIDGIFLKLSSIDAGIATIEEIRNALLDFKKSKKFLISYADFYTQGTYYLASVSDKIYTNPQGGMDFVGLSMQVMFFKRVFEKFGIEPIIIRHGKFKSAVEPFLLDKMSEANEEQLSTFTKTIWTDILQKISIERKIELNRLNEIADKLLVKNAISSVELGLVDSLKYYDEVLLQLMKKTQSKSLEDLEFVSLATYSKVPKKKVDNKEKGLSKDKIAVVFATGEIVMGKGDDSNIGAESLSSNIRKLRNDDKIKAIVLRINSPGGSALASEIIWHEVFLAKKEKPVIVSMGDYAASGGYYIACAADSIIADPNTLTGSIGVFGVLFNIQKLLNDKIGITVDRVNTNKFSDIGTVTRKMEKEEESYIQGSIEDIYSTFIKHVADGRGMTVEAIDSIGQGRIWSGINALKLGLVDKLGGMEDAIEIAAKKANLENYRIVNYPQPKDPFDTFIEIMDGNVRSHVFEQEINDFEPYFEMYKNLSKQKGVQARLPFNIIYN